MSAARAIGHGGAMCGDWQTCHPGCDFRQSLLAAMSFAITSFYKFLSLSAEEVERIRVLLHNRCSAAGILGLIVLGPEGVNATVSGEPQALASFKRWLTTESPFAPLECKDSSAEKPPFRRLRIDLRPEIVTFGHAVASPELMEQSFLSPAEWHARVTSANPPMIIDVRNRYETALGRFKGAIDPETDCFTEFPEFVEKRNLPKDQEILMYCTGGIRCEKALGYMNSKGYKMRQLAGGILKYLEEFPGGAFEGECFVFDHRVAVDQDLLPSRRFILCVHCGNPADQRLECENCGVVQGVCQACQAVPDRRSCSKNCAYHLRRQQ
ncbi:MAG: hypothetical protein EBZ48_03630 [Proteobacteria bacterium]|nr:hypothetical protein [Pseudomonadota bacterium]